MKKHPAGDGKTVPVKVQDVKPVSARELARVHGMGPLPEDMHRLNLRRARLRYGRKV